MTNFLEGLIASIPSSKRVIQLCSLQHNFRYIMSLPSVGWSGDDEARSARANRQRVQCDTQQLETFLSRTKRELCVRVFAVQVQQSK